MFPFFLDDDMMDYVQPNKMFDIVVTDSPGPEADGKVDLQLVNLYFLRLEKIVPL